MTEILLMTDTEVIAMIATEIQAKTLGVTEQYLQIHQPVYTNNTLNVERTDRERTDNTIIAYLPVVNQRFYFAFYIDTTPKAITGLATEARICVFFRANSAWQTLDELKAMTSLTATKCWNNGEPKRGDLLHTYSYWELLPNAEPDELEDKLHQLLTILEQDKAGVQQLVQKANGYIQVVMDNHNGNGMIGGPNISREAIKRMAALDLSINFDLYVEGKSFLD